MRFGNKMVDLHGRADYLLGGETIPTAVVGLKCNQFSQGRGNVGCAHAVTDSRSSVMSRPCSFSRAIASARTSRARSYYRSRVSAMYRSSSVRPSR